MFSEAVLDHFHRPRNPGAPEGANREGTAGVPGDGPYMRIWLTMEGETIVRAGFETYGCPAAIACGSLLTMLAAGRGRAAALAVTSRDLALVLGGLPEGKEHCADLATEALRDALESGFERGGAAGEK